MPSQLHAEPLAGPTVPVLPNLKEDLVRPHPEIPSKLAELTDHLDAYAGKLATSPHPLPVLDLPARVSAIVGTKVSILWPDGLYIPSDADWKQYWFLPPEPGKNRYGHEWTIGFAPPNSASFKTGHLFAFAAARPTDSKLRSEAGIGFVYQPSPKLALYSVEVKVNLLGQNRCDINTTAPAGGAIHEWGGLYTAAWEINPVNGDLELHKPYGVVTLFDETYLNLTGTPINNWPKSGTIKTNIFLEGGGRTYLISVIAAVQIDNNWRWNNGGPMQNLPEGSVWKAWCDIVGDIPQVWISPSIVYMP